jgi:carbon-monoxide dehydrogenase small subunit
LKEEKKEETKGLSRREFLKDAGLIVGGATVGSMALVNACSGGTTTTTVTAPGGTKTVTSTTTSVVAGPGGSVVTVTQPGTTVTAAAATKYVCSLDNLEFNSLAELNAHFASVHPNVASADSFTVLTVNGVTHGILTQPHWSLAYLLREQFGLFALKEGCQLGECGACTVDVDGKAVFSCLMLACEMGGKTVTTVEGLSNNGVLGPVQQKFYDQDVAQCGYCTPGFIMAAEALYKTNPKPTMDETREAMGGHMCMCGNVHRNLNCIAGGV